MDAGELKAATARAVAPSMARLLWACATSLAVLSVAVLVTSVLVPDQLPLPPPAFRAAAAFVLLASVAVLRIDLARAVVGGRGRWLVESYLMALAVLGTSLRVAYGQFTLAALLTAVLMIVSGLVARPVVTGAILALAVAGEIAGELQAGGGDWTTAVGFVGLATLIAWVARYVGTSNLRLVRGQVLARHRAEERTAQVSAVAAAAGDIHVLDAEAMFVAVADATARLGWDLCAVYVPLPGADHLVLASGRGIDVTTVVTPREGGVLAQVLETRVTVVRDDYRRDERRNLRHDEIDAVVGAPVVANGDTIGAVVVARRTAGIEPADIGLVELLAAQAGRAMETLRSFDLQRRAMEEVERAGRVKDDFVATVSHELRTPLHVVLGMAETLDARWDDLPPEVLRDLAGSLRRNAGDLHALVEVLLDFSRIESGSITIRPRGFDLIEVLHTVVERIGTLHPEHALTAQLPVRGIASVVGDPLLIERVVENLVLNACRHTPPGTAVRVVVEEGGAELRLSVRDDGPGIPPGDLPRLGERFYRGEEDHLRRETRGVGLGLAFCNEVLQLHGATLHVESVEGHGAEFGFTLPRPGTGASVLSDRRETSVDDEVRTPSAAGAVSPDQL